MFNYSPKDCEYLPDCGRDTQNNCIVNVSANAERVSSQGLVLNIVLYRRPLLHNQNDGECCWNVRWSFRDWGGLNYRSLFRVVIRRNLSSKAKLYELYENSFWARAKKIRVTITMAYTLGGTTPRIAQKKDTQWKDTTQGLLLSVSG